MQKRPYRDEKTRRTNEALKKQQRERVKARALRRKAARVAIEAPAIPVEELTDAGV